MDGKENAVRARGLGPDRAPPESFSVLDGTLVSQSKLGVLWGTGKQEI